MHIENSSQRYVKKLGSGQIFSCIFGYLDIQQLMIVSHRRLNDSCGEEEQGMDFRLWIQRLAG